MAFMRETPAIQSLVAAGEGGRSLLNLALKHSQR
jgi:hypothetical protein